MKPGIFKYLKTFSYIFRNYYNGDGVYPFYASLKLTSRCESRCFFCNIPQENNSRELKTDEIKKLIEKLVSSSILVLTLEGGEPFVRDDIGEILEFANRFPILLSVVTSYPERIIKNYASLSKLIDFLQVSIDEGHCNTHLFEKLNEIRLLWNTRVCIQTVVTNDTIPKMEEKVSKAHESGLKILFLPVSSVCDGISGLNGEKELFVRRVKDLKAKYPKTVFASSYFFKSYENQRGCTSSSIVIDSDGSLFYPCHILGDKPLNLLSGDLIKFFPSNDAKKMREKMKCCTKACGCYQYSAVSLKSFLDLPGDIKSSIERV